MHPVKLTIYTLIGVAIFSGYRQLTWKRVDYRFKSDVSALLSPKKTRGAIIREIVGVAHEYGVDLDPQMIQVKKVRPRKQKMLKLVDITKQTVLVSFTYQIRGILFMRDKVYSGRKTEQLQATLIDPRPEMRQTR